MRCKYCLDTIPNLPLNYNISRRSFSKFWIAFYLVIYCHKRRMYVELLVAIVILNIDCAFIIMYSADHARVEILPSFSTMILADDRGTYVKNRLILHRSQYDS